MATPISNKRYPETGSAYSANKADINDPVRTRVDWYPFRVGENGAGMRFLTSAWHSSYACATSDSAPASQSFATTPERIHPFKGCNQRWAYWCRNVFVPWVATRLVLLSVTAFQSLFIPPERIPQLGFRKLHMALLRHQALLVYIAHGEGLDRCYAHT